MKGPTTGAQRRRTVLRELVRHRDLRRIELGFAAFAVCEHGTWLAVIVFAYQRGGSSEAGVAAFALLAPSALAAPLTVAVLDRVPRHRSLGIGFVAQAATMALVAVSMLADAGAALVYLAALGSAVTMTMSRPALAGVLPSVARTPAQLTAANAAAGFAESVGRFAGPAGAGLIIATSSAGAVFAVGTVLMAVAALASFRVEHATSDLIDREEDPERSGADRFLGGIRVLRDRPEARVLVVMLAGTAVVVGALDVAFVAVADELLDGGGATAGLLGAAAGGGRLAGASLAFSLVGRRRLTVPVVVGVVAVGVPVAAMAASHSQVLTVALLALSGAGAAIVGIAGRTMLQSLAADDVLARLFGVLEGLNMAALAVGALGLSALIAAFGLTSALVLTGLALPLLMALRSPVLLGIDRGRVMVDPDLVAFVRGVPMFAPLPAFQVEQLLMNFHRLELEPGQQLFTLGVRGDTFYLVAAGTAEVTRSDGGLVTLGPGDHFGEIALLRDGRRTASVAAGTEGLGVYVLDRDTFLEAVTGYPRIRARVSAVAQRRLDSDRPPADPDGWAEGVQPS